MSISDRFRRIVVAGNGIAGLTACDTLRAEGFEGEIVVVGAERAAAYSRPALSKALLNPDGDEASHELPPATHGAIELRGISALGLAPDARRVALSDSSELEYDGLVIATGARSRRLTASRRERTLRELGDAVALRDALATKPSVLVVGGGVLGMEIASGAVASGCEVTVVATAPPMSRQLGGHLSALIADVASERGLTVVEARTVSITEDGDEVLVHADGTTLTAEVVVSAVGDVPNTEWLRDSGLLRGGGLVADGRGRIAEGIVAAGDVAMWQGPRGAWRLPLWTSAIEQAKTAAAALLRGDDAAELDLQPYFWTEQFGLAVKAVGPLPLRGPAEVLAQDGDGPSALLRWPHPDGSSTAVAVNHRIPIPKLRRLTHAPAVTVV